MRAKILPAAITIGSLFGSTLMAAAQTGEFAVQVPGPVVHDAWEIQDPTARCPIWKAGEPFGANRRQFEFCEAT